MIYRGALSGLLGIMLIAFSLGSSVMLGFTFGYSDYIACSLAWKFDNEISMSGSGFVQCLDKLDLVDYPSLKIKNLRATVDKSDYTTPINILSDLRYNDQFIKKDFVRIYDYSTPLKMAAVSDILVSKKDNIIVLNYVQGDPLRDWSGYEINPRKEVIGIDGKFIEKMEWNNINGISPMIIYEDSQYIKKIFFSDSSRTYIPEPARSIPLYNGIYLQSYSKKTAKSSIRLLYPMDLTSPDDLGSMKEVSIKKLNRGFFIVNRNYKQLSTSDKTWNLSARDILQFMGDAIKKRYM